MTTNESHPSRFRSPRKAALQIGTAGILLLAFWAIVLTRLAGEDAKWMRVDAEKLAHAYVHNPAEAKRLYQGRHLVVSGTFIGMDGGLFGDGMIYLSGGRDGEIHCDVNGNFGGVGGSDEVEIEGVCEGKDEHGPVRLASARVRRVTDVSRSTR